jgi:ubiquinone/menaquinone biosynthesis C-methylase UbiE
MEANTSGTLKQRVHDFWNAQACDAQVAQSARFSREYFEEIETFRYQDQPFIHSFAQFTCYHGKRVLEVGVGAGTDFIQWLRSGALASGVDLTEEAIENVRHRVETYNLPPPQELKVADAENLPFASDAFDLGYSFGVLHHTPDTEKALRELVRVIRPGGQLKVMLYNRHSIYILNRWVRFALLQGRPWHTLSWILANKVENAGTKGYARSELLKMFGALPLQNIRILTEATSADYLSSSAFVPLNFLYRCALRLAGSHYPWDIVRYAARINDPGKPGRSVEANSPRPDQPILGGNPLGFFHCVSAEKT